MVGQRSPIDNLLNFVKSKLYSHAKNETNTVHRILFIITENVALNSTVLSAFPVKELQDDGVDVFLLIVGKHVTENEPNKVDSKPFKSHVFRVNSFRDLSRLSKSFRGKGKIYSPL